MVNQGVFEEITLDQATEEEKRNIIGSKWVHRSKGDEVRSRIVGLGYDEVINPVHCISKILEHQGRRHQHSIFHALRGATTNILLKPPSEFYTNKNIYILETEEGDVWSQVITKSLARPSSKHHERTGLHTAHIRAQCVQASRRKGIHHGLCQRSIFCRKNRGDQQHLQQDPRKDVTTSNW